MNILLKHEYIDNRWALQARAACYSKAFTWGYLQRLQIYSQNLLPINKPGITSVLSRSSQIHAGKGAGEQREISRWVMMVF